MLAKATEKTQRPFLRRCLTKTEKVLSMLRPADYLKGMVKKLLEGYCGAAGAVFDEQREDLGSLFALIPGTSREDIDDALGDIGFHSRVNKLKASSNGSYFDDVAHMASVFHELDYVGLDYDALAKDRVALLEFMVRFRFIELVRSGGCGTRAYHAFDSALCERAGGGVEAV